MGEILLESLSRKQLLLFVLILFFFMSAFFVIGGTKGADPATANIHISNKFVNDSFDSDTGWLWYVHTNENFALENGLYEGKIIDIEKNHTVDAKRLVFSTKFPHPADLPMHRVNQFMLVIMNIQLDFMVAGKLSKLNYKIDCKMTFDAKLGYTDDKEVTTSTEWKLLQRVQNQTRPLVCHFTSFGGEHSKETGYYMCEDQHFFELGSVTHKHYLVNVHLPVDNHNIHCLANYTYYLSGLHFVEIHQNGGYTISLFVSKTVMFPFIMAALLFFVRRIKREQRQWLLLEKAIACVGVALNLLLFPVDWFTLVMDMPYMLFFSDLRQGLFYTALLIFWSLFAGEHILDQEERNKLSSYKYEIGSIVIGCVSLFLFDTVERGVQLANPFHTIWKRDTGEKVAKAFIGLAAAAAIIYCLFFLRLLYYVRKNINLKSVALPAMQDERRLFYENKIYRFRVLLYTTLFTVFVTVVCFIFDQINETSWKFQEDSMNDYVIVSSAMHFGVFGLWGTYVFAVLILYSPNSKTTDSRINVQYKRSEHLLHAVDTLVDDGESDDEIRFQSPKKL